MPTRDIAVAVITIFLSMHAISGHAEEPAKPLDEIYAFLKDNVVNRKMVREDEGTIAGGAVAYHFRREAVLCNLGLTNESLAYDEIFIIKQQNWDTKDGVKLGEPRVEDRIIARRVVCDRLKSTGEVVGHAAGLTSTRSEWHGDANLIRIQIKDARLHIEERTGLYTDYFAPGGSFYPGASNTNYVLYLKDGKLVREARDTTYRIDPKTMEKELVEKTSEEKPDIELEEARLPF